MGYYADQPLRHSHRSPAEIAEDDIAAALRGDFCGVMASASDGNGETREPTFIPRRRTLVPLPDRLRSTREP